MNNDMIEEVVEAQLWLLEKHIPSIGPLACMPLLRIEEEILKQKDVPRLIKRYAKDIRFVCVMLAIHQGAVIGQLDAMIHDPAAMLMREILKGPEDFEDESVN